MRCAVITLVAGGTRTCSCNGTGLLAGVLLPDQHIVVAMNDPAAREVLDSQAPRPDVVEMPCAPGPLPLARARNPGAQRALSDGADLLIFLDVDCVPGPLLVQRYLQHAA